MSDERRGGIARALHVQVPFFRPAWRRAVVTIVVLGWSLVEFWAGNPAWGMEGKNYRATLESCEASLEKLKLNFVDLYLIHAPFAQQQRLEQWRALVELKRQGKARAIGVSNYRQPHLEEIEETAEGGVVRGDFSVIEVPEVTTQLGRRLDAAQNEAAYDLHPADGGV